MKIRGERMENLQRSSDDQASHQATYFGQFGLVLDTFASLLTSG